MQKVFGALQQDFGLAEIVVSDFELGEEWHLDCSNNIMLFKIVSSSVINLQVMLHN